MSGAGQFLVSNRYPGPLTLTMNGKAYKIPANTEDFPVDLPPGEYTFSALIPGIGEQPATFFTVINLSAADITLVFAPPAN